MLKLGAFSIMGALVPPSAPDFAKAEFGFYLRDAAEWEALCREAGFREVNAEIREFTQARPDGAIVKRTGVLASVAA